MPCHVGDIRSNPLALHPTLSMTILYVTINRPVAIRSYPFQHSFIAFFFFFRCELFVPYFVLWSVKTYKAPSFGHFPDPGNPRLISHFSGNCQFAKWQRSSHILCFLLLCSFRCCVPGTSHWMAPEVISWPTLDTLSFDYCPNEIIGSFVFSFPWKVFVEGVLYLLEGNTMVSEYLSYACVCAVQQLCTTTTITTPGTRARAAINTNEMKIWCPFR